jgi:hypothetical protein
MNLVQKSGWTACGPSKGNRRQFSSERPRALNGARSPQWRIALTGLRADFRVIGPHGIDEWHLTQHVFGMR